MPYVAPDEAQSPLWWLAAFSPQTLALAGTFTIVVIAAFALLVKRMRGREKEYDEQISDDAKPVSGLGACLALAMAWLW